MDTKTTDPNESLWRDLMRAGRDDDGSAAQAHLDAGFPIYYAEDDTPAELLIKEYPDGHRELVRYRKGNDEVIRAL